MTKQELKDIVLKAKEEKRSLTEEEKTLINSEIEARQKPQAEEPQAEPEVKDEPKVEEPKQTSGKQELYETIVALYAK